MNIQIIAVGAKMPAWVNEAFQEYQKRLLPEIQLQLKEIPVQKTMQLEGQQIINAIKPGSYTIALDSRGKQYSSEQLAEQLNLWKHLAKPINILIGGPEGYTTETLAKADAQWSLSALTFPHPIVRIILAEQLYRAQSILKGHPYHRY
jgi:23S rRNA (pseudouridine1915-N3)-methyltransferase